MTRRQLLECGYAGAAGLVVGGIGGSLISGGGDSGASGSASGGGGKNYVLGCAYPQSGSAAGDGDDATTASKLAIDAINNSGGINGRKIEQTIVDLDPFTAQGISTAFQRLVNERVDAITIPYVFLPKAAYDIVAPYGCPYLNGNASAAQVKLTSDDPDKYRMIFQLVTSEDWYGRGIVPLLDELERGGGWRPGKHTIHIVQGDDPYSTTISKAAQSTIKASGRWDVAGVTSIVAPVNDWGPVLKQVRATNPGVIMCTHWVPAELASLTKQFAANPTDSLLYLQYGPSVPEFLRLAGDSANGVVWATLSGILPDEKGVQFKRDYEAVSNKQPGLTYSGLIYDQVNMLAQAWAMVGDPRRFDAVSDVLRKMTFRGVNGSYQFAGPGQNAIAYPGQTRDPSVGIPHLFVQIQDGEMKVIAPEPYVESAFKTPPWLT